MLTLPKYMSSHWMFRVVRVVQFSFLCTFFCDHCLSFIFRMLYCSSLRRLTDCQYLFGNFKLVLWYAMFIWSAKSKSCRKFIWIWCDCLLSYDMRTLYFKLGPSWPWSYGSWIYNYLCNQWLSLLILWVRISIRARLSTLCYKVCQWLATGRRFSPGPSVSSTNNTDSHAIAKVLLKVALNTKQTNKQSETLYQFKCQIRRYLFFMLQLFENISVEIISYCKDNLREEQNVDIF